MRRWWLGLMVVVGVLAATPALCDSTAVAPPDAAPGVPPAVPAKAPVAGSKAPKASSKSRPAPTRTSLKVRRVVLRVNHRVFQNFAEVDTVGFKKDFRIGDTDMTARIIDFVPDFTIGRDRKVVSRTDEPRNPAVRIVVKEKGAPHDTSWAFLNFPPHFSNRAVLAFQVLRIDFENHEPLLNKALRDTTAAGGKPR
ncbi:MAG: hypothetical protein A2W00_05820 [Candidatus Eisenbacteria bacterium RBG_16_71_46]|nr:MAG: hypothetical protein A2W00_05820 [Candidatus Eisenbacteria bacterium RBG_16_71_46]OGF23847.1 MAG: hypothetical protein A2V63_13495 [Candidatus Eisenbacteria bacterium RBG_19FT_COMBO_70_11]